LYIHYIFSQTLGFTTDGEFNSLRTAGNRRPVSIIELIRSARKEANGIRVKDLTPCFKLGKDGMYLVFCYVQYYSGVTVAVCDYLNTFPMLSFQVNH
jgi:hypothetical protein